jgi:hypothetical protein
MRLAPSGRVGSRLVETRPVGCFVIDDEVFSGFLRGPARNKVRGGSVAIFTLSLLCSGELDFQVSGGCWILSSDWLVCLWNTLQLMNIEALDS